MGVAVQHDRCSKVWQRPKNMPCELQHHVRALSSNTKLGKQLAHGESKMGSATCTQCDCNVQLNNTAFNTYCAVQPCHIPDNEQFIIAAIYTNYETTQHPPPLHWIQHSTNQRLDRDWQYYVQQIRYTNVETGHHPYTTTPTCFQ